MKVVAIGRVVLTSREAPDRAGVPREGHMGIPLRYPYEVREEDDYFGDIPEPKVARDAMDLAKHIVETKAGHFHPDKFEDRYETALRELVKRKEAGERIEAPREKASGKVVNLMDALRQSLAGTAHQKKPPGPSHKHRAPSRARKPGRKLKKAS